MDGWTLAIYAIVAYVALSSLVILMRRHRNRYESSLSPLRRGENRTVQTPPRSPEIPSSPAEAESSNGEGSS